MLLFNPQSSRKSPSQFPILCIVHFYVDHAWTLFINETELQQQEKDGEEEIELVRFFQYYGLLPSSYIHLSIYHHQLGW